MVAHDLLWLLGCSMYHSFIELMREELAGFGHLHVFLFKCFFCWEAEEIFGAPIAKCICVLQLIVDDLELFPEVSCW